MKIIKLLSSPSVLYYLLLFSGVTMLAGPLTALLQVAALLFMNRLLALLLRKSSLPAPLLTIVALGTFWMLYLPAALLLKGNYHYLLSALLLCCGLVYTRKAPPPDREPQFPAATLVAVFLILALLTFLPFRNLGRETAEGFAYRAYFSSDYLKHYAVCQQLNNGRIPPENPYFAGSSWNYYWLSYTFPSYFAALTGNTEQSMKGWSLIVNFSFLLALLSLLGRFVSRTGLLRYLALLFPFFFSLEGLLLLSRQGGAALKTFTGMNIDALSRWWYALPEINTVFRSLLYTPQHLLSLALAVLLLIFLPEEKNLLLKGALLALSLLSSFFLGGALIAILGLWQLAGALLKLLEKRFRFREFLADNLRLFLPSLAGAALIVLLGMNSARSGGFLYLQFPAAASVARLLFLNFGLQLTLAFVALFFLKKREHSFYKFAFLLTLPLIVFTRWRGFENDFSLKTGLLTALFMAVLGASLLSRIRKQAALPLAAFIILAGAPTLAADLWNSADISNRQFTSLVSKDERRALKILQARFPQPQTIAMLAGERSSFFSLVPSFTRHRLYLGDPMHATIFQVSREEYDERLFFLRQTLGRLPYSRGLLLQEKCDLVWWSQYESDFFQSHPPAGLKQVFRAPELRLLQLR